MTYYRAYQTNTGRIYIKEYDDNKKYIKGSAKLYSEVPEDFSVLKGLKMSTRPSREIVEVINISVVQGIIGVSKDVHTHKDRGISESEAQKHSTTVVQFKIDILGYNDEIFQMGHTYNFHKYIPPEEVDAKVIDIMNKIKNKIITGCKGDSKDKMRLSEFKITDINVRYVPKKR